MLRRSEGGRILSARAVRLLFGMENSRRLSQVNVDTAQRLDAEAVALAFGWRCNQVATARALAEIEESGHYLRRGHRTMAEYGETMGCPAAETEMLTAVGRALKRRPALREQVLTGKVLLEEAALLGRAEKGETNPLPGPPTEPERGSLGRRDPGG